MHVICVTCSTSAPGGPGDEPPVQGKRDHGIVPRQAGFWFAGEQTEGAAPVRRLGPISVPPRRAAAMRRKSHGSLYRSTHKGERTECAVLKCVKHTQLCPSRTKVNPAGALLRAA